MFVADVCMKINRWKLEALGCNTKQESNEHSHVLDHSHQFFLDTTAAFSKSGTDVALREEKIQSKVESYKNDCNPQEPPNEWDPHACEVQSTLAFSWKFSNYTLFPCEVSRPKTWNVLAWLGFWGNRCQVRRFSLHKGRTPLGSKSNGFHRDRVFWRFRNKVGKGFRGFLNKNISSSGKNDIWFVSFSMPSYIWGFFQTKPCLLDPFSSFSSFLVCVVQSTALTKMQRAEKAEN